MIIMAKGRGMGRYIKGNIDIDFVLGTLAANTGVVQQTNDQVRERTLVTSVDVSYGMLGFTIIDNVGPIEVGLAHEDYTLAEIEEYLELTTSWDEGDRISREISSRLIRRIGVFEPKEAGLGSEMLNDGKPIKTKLNWILNSGQGLKFWAYNQGSAAVATTDPNIHIVGHANLFPQ